MPYTDIIKKHINARECSRRYRQRHPERRRQTQRNYYWNHHKDVLAQMREYRHQNPERVHNWRIKAALKLRTMVINAYGGRCACCCETELAFLCIDHLNGGGTQHRFQVGMGQRFYEYLKREGFPPGYQVLCYNCNAAKELPGGCPHQRNRDKEHA